MPVLIYAGSYFISFLVYAGSRFMLCMLTPISYLFFYVCSYFMPVLIYAGLFSAGSYFCGSYSMPMLVFCSIFSGRGIARRTEAGGMHLVLPNGMHSAAR